MYYYVLSPLDLKAFLLHVTGKLVVKKASIKVQFLDHDDFGAVTTHTCSNELIFPGKEFVTNDTESYDRFCAILKSVIDDKSLSFNMV